MYFYGNFLCPAFSFFRLLWMIVWIFHNISLNFFLFAIIIFNWNIFLLFYHNSQFNPSNIVISPVVNYVNANLLYFYWQISSKNIISLKTHSKSIATATAYPVGIWSEWTDSQKKKILKYISKNLGKNMLNT